MKNVIIDTDIGMDVDDTIALLSSLYHPGLNVKAVITSSGDLFSKDVLKNRTRLVHYILENTGYNSVKVAMGENSSNHYGICALNDLPDYSINTNYKKTIDNILEDNKQVHYLNIGPLTNLSEYLKENPESAKKFNLVLMGCRFKKDRGEHNIKEDLPSARHVFSVKDLKKTVIPSDVTNNNAILVDSNSNIYKRSLNSEFLKKVVVENMDFMPRFFLHDVVAELYLINESFFKTVKADIRINEDCTSDYKLNPKSKTRLVTSVFYSKVVSLAEDAIDYFANLHKRDTYYSKKGIIGEES